MERVEKLMQEYGLEWRGSKLWDKEGETHCFLDHLNLEFHCWRFQVYILDYEHDDIRAFTKEWDLKSRAPLF